MTTNTEPMELQPMLPAQQGPDNRIVEIEEGNSSCCSRYSPSSRVCTFF